MFHFFEYYLFSRNSTLSDSFLLTDGAISTFSRNVNVFCRVGEEMQDNSSSSSVH